MTAINDMIRKTDGRRKEILLHLKKLNKKAYLHMRERHKGSFKPKYRALQRTDTWKEAKKLLIEFTLMNDGYLRCKVCRRQVQNPTMHHNDYVDAEYFSPPYIDFIHKGCHSKELDKKKKN